MVILYPYGSAGQNALPSGKPARQPAWLLLKIGGGQGDRFPLAQFDRDAPLTVADVDGRRGFIVAGDFAAGQTAVFKIQVARIAAEQAQSVHFAALPGLRQRGEQKRRPGTFLFLIVWFWL